MKEKETKENQGIRDACQVVRVLQTRQRGSRRVAGGNHALEKSTRKTSPPSAEGLSLMQEKVAKENQGIRDACQVGRVSQTRQRGSCQVACIRPNFAGGRSRLDLLLPSFLLSREEKKGPFLRERRDLCQVAGDNHALEKSTRQTARLSIGGFFLMREMKAPLSPFLSLMRKMKAPLSPFLSLMKEKEAKENQGIGDAGQVSRVP